MSPVKCLCNCAINVHFVAAENTKKESTATS